MCSPTLLRVSRDSFTTFKVLGMFSIKVHSESNISDIDRIIAWSDRRWVPVPVSVWFLRKNLWICWTGTYLQNINNLKELYPKDTFAIIKEEKNQLIQLNQTMKQLKWFTEFQNVENSILIANDKTNVMCWI